MKILLAACNAKYIHSNLAVYDLKAYSSDYDEHVILREYTINQLKDEILKDIYSSGADVVCFSCYIWNISFVRELIRDLVKILPKTAFGQAVRRFLTMLKIPDRNAGDDRSYGRRRRKDIS